MAGNLIKVDEFEISSNVGSVILGGGSNGSSGLNASIDSTFDVYVVRFTNLKCNYDTSNTYLRVTTSGTADTSNNYDRAHTVLWSSNTFADVYTQNGSYWAYNQNGTGTGESQNGIMYLFDFASSSRLNADNLILNGGEEYGAYEQAINHLDIDDNDVCFFMHDDLIVKYWDFVEMCKNSLEAKEVETTQGMQEVKIIGNGTNYLVENYDYNKVIDVGINRLEDGSLVGDVDSVSYTHLTLPTILLV